MCPRLPASPPLAVSHFFQALLLLHLYFQLIYAPKTTAAFQGPDEHLLSALCWRGAIKALQ